MAKEWAPLFADENSIPPEQREEADGDAAQREPADLPHGPPRPEPGPEPDPGEPPSYALHQLQVEPASGQPQQGTPPPTGSGRGGHRTFPGSLLGALAHPASTQQILLLAWCLWLLLSWLSVWWLHATLPAIRWMLILGMVGMMTLWPAVRLSQAQVHRFRWRRQRLAAGQTLGDWLSMNAIFQAVIWLLYWAGTRPELDAPPGITGGGWTAVQTLQISSTVLGWSLWCGLILWAGLQLTSGLGRTLAMAGCLALLLAEPALAAAVNLLAGQGAAPGEAGWTWPWLANPLAMLWSLSDVAGRRQDPAVAAETVRVLTVLGGATLAWLAVWLTVARSAARARQASGA